MAAGLGGALVLGAAVTLLLASLRLSDGSLLLAARPPRLRLVGDAPPSEPRDEKLADEDGDGDVVGDAAERWLLYEPGDRHQHAALPPPWSKRAETAPDVPKGLASQFVLRSTRGNRQYDVPQIECPPAEDGMERFACPTPDRMGRYRCIDDHVLCDGFIDCPSGEDEDRQACMFYKTTKAHLDVLADALLRWARGR